MFPSPLRDFNRRSIDELLSEGVEMRYDRSLRKKNYWGLWKFQEYSVCIDPYVREQEGKRIEDVVIIHEWLHAYEDIILDLSKDFRETQIDWWAYFHLRRDKYIADYIRSFFPEFIIL